MLDLTSLNNNDRNIALIRHTERFKIPEGELGDNILITPNGEKMAVSFGEKIKEYNLSKLFVSPIKRCVQTAEKIVEGYGKQVEIIPSQMLGDPSAFVKDKKIAYEVIQNTAFFEGYFNFLDDKRIDGFYTLSEGSARLETFIKETSSENGLTLYVSHDIIIMYFIYYKLKKIFTPENWLNFLDGIKINYSTDSYTISE